MKSLTPKFPQHECAYGFVKGKSTHHHVERHAQSTKYLVMDIQNFFFQQLYSSSCCNCFGVSYNTFQSQIKALLFLSMEYNFEETHHRKTSILTFFQSIQRLYFHTFHESIGRRLGRLIARMAFSSHPFLHTHEYIFDEHFFIDIRKLHDIHQNMWSKDPYQLVFFFWIATLLSYSNAYWVITTLYRQPSRHLPMLELCKTEETAYIDTVSTFMKTGVPHVTHYHRSPLSPWLANLCCYELDVHIQHYAQKTN